MPVSSLVSGLRAAAGQQDHSRLSVVALGISSPHPAAAAEKAG